MENQATEPIIEFLDVKKEYFLYKNEKFLKNNGKQIAVNTVRQELTDIAKECDFKNPRGKKRK